MKLLDVQTDDLQVFEEVLSRAFARMRLGRDDESPTTSTMTRHTLGDMTLDRLVYGFDLHYRGDPLHRLNIFTVEAGTFAEHTTGSVTDTFGPGDVATLAAPDLPYAGHLRRAAFTVMMLDPALLDTLAEPVPGRKAETVHLTGHRTLDGAAAQRVRITVQFLQRLAALPDADASPLVTGSAARLLAACVLACFPSNARLEATGQDRHDAHPDALRRAITHIETHPDRDLTLADIAAAAHVSIRAVQQAFRRHLDTTPTSYLRRVRLAQAHRDLLAADPRTDSVTAIAARWGFGNASRFAATYRDAYGHPPSHTLRH